MAKNGYKVLDSNMHVQEPWDLWLNYIEPKYRDQAPIGTARVARSDQPPAFQRVYVLLALDDVHRLGPEDLWQAVRNRLHALEVPDPVVAVRPTLAEALGLEANDLIQQLAGWVGVVVRSDDLVLALGCGLLVPADDAEDFGLRYLEVATAM